MKIIFKENIIFIVLIIIIILSLYYLYFNYHITAYTHEYEYMFVTSFYAGRSKHAPKKFKQWINYFSNVINENLYIFCNKEGYELLNTKIQKYVYKINDVFDNEKIRDYRDKYKEMWKIDPEYFIHNYRLYGIWNGKISMLKYVSEHVKSKIYIWIDIGSNRENKTFTNFPSINKIKYLQSITNNSYMFFFQLFNFSNVNNQELSLLRNDAIQAGSFGGSKSGIKKYFDVYFSLHDRFLKQKEFVGKEQTLYNTIAYYNLSKVVLLKYKENSCNNDEWFRFYDFYADLDCANVTITKN